MILVADKSFKKAFKRLIKKNPQLENKVLSVLELLTKNPLIPSLKSHKLTGQLEGLRSCSVTYDCRIIYSLERDELAENDLIILIDIGTHDEIY